MNRSELERELRREAQAIRPRCPDTPRQRVVRTLRQRTETQARPRGGVGWLPAASTAVLALIVAGVLWLSPTPEPPAGEVLAETATGELPAERLGVLAGVGLDRALADREASLEAELERIQADLEKIKALVSRAG